jgi:hypothetical protein
MEPISLGRRPSHAQLGEAITQTHRCLESHKALSAARHEVLRAELGLFRGRLSRWGLFLGVMTSLSGLKVLIEILKLIWG